jgi:DNA-binding NtrC family response regulator
LATCLVVDSAPAAQETLVQTLAHAGHEVEFASSGARAAARLMARVFDVMIVTEHVSGASGRPFVSFARELDPGIAIVVLAEAGMVETADSLRPWGLLAVVGVDRFDQVCELVTKARRNALVAVVEDDLSLADNLSEILALAGFSTVHAADLDAVDGIEDLQLAAGIVDLRLPGGADGAGLERLSERFPSLPIISVTALETRPQRPTYDHLFKPLNAARLLALLDQIHERAAVSQ